MTSALLTVLGALGSIASIVSLVQISTRKEVSRLLQPDGSQAGNAASS